VRLHWIRGRDGAAVSPWPGAFAIVLVAIVLVGVVGTVHQYLRARRNERQVEDDRRMRIGMHTARRMGWLPDDLQ
jgi:hypothetical protein